MQASSLQPNNLATFRKLINRLPDAWPTFLHNRQSRLAQQERNGIAAEKVAENILEDFFTIALDWDICDLNNQLHYADIVLTKQGIKRLLIEVKRPGSLGWEQHSLEHALSQARRYADEQRVRTIAVSDGILFYAADVFGGGLRDRARLVLDAPACSPDVWWVSVDGIYRPPVGLAESASAAAPPSSGEESGDVADTEMAQVLLHPKYRVPAECFAYVGDASKPATWKLPCRHIGGAVDEGHLSGAIRAVLSNYRGAHVKTVPDTAMPEVLVRLGKAAAEIGKLPGQTPAPSATYQQLYDALYQLERLPEVLEP
jgi:hypothetical protein